MRVLKTMIVITAMSLPLVATPAYAQAPSTQKPDTQKPATPPPATLPPATQQPATPPPAAAAPAPAPKPPAPFPEGAKFAFVDIQAVASNSAEGKAATAKLDELRKKKNTELLAKNNSLKAMQDKLQAGGSVLNDTARAQLEKDIEKAQRDMQFAQQDAQTEVTDLTNQLQADFQEKLNPVIEQLRVDKGLLMIFSIRDSGVVAAEPGLDLSSEVIKRFDAARRPRRRSRIRGRFAVSRLGRVVSDGATSCFWANLRAASREPRAANAIASPLLHSSECQSIFPNRWIVSAIAIRPRSLTRSPNTSPGVEWSPTRTSPSARSFFRGISPALR